MSIVNKMWMSNPQKMTKLSDLPDGFVARMKFYNANEDYTLESFSASFNDYQKSVYCSREAVELCKTLDGLCVVDYINNSHFKNELDIFTPDFDKKRTHHMTSQKSDDDILHVRVYSKNGLIKEYSMPAKGMSMQDLSTLIDKERSIK